jgi:hypothetical protein
MAADKFCRKENSILAKIGFRPIWKCPEIEL